MVPPIVVGAKALSKKYAIVAVQSLLAALAEETSIDADENGIRGKGGRFISKHKAILRIFGFVATIGFIVQYVPPLLRAVFVDVHVQSLGLAVILADLVIHKFVDQWNYKEDYAANFIGGLLIVVPYVLHFY